MNPRRLPALLLPFVLAAASAAAAQGPPPPLPAEALRDEVDPAKLAYLRAHEVAAGPVTGGVRFRLPAAFYRSRLILLGESHGSAAPQVLDLELLTHLNARTGLRDYLAEVDPVQAARLNAFLETGDEAPLLRVFALWRPEAQWGNTAFLVKLRAMRELNLRLPPGRRIRLHGIDAVQDWPLLLDWLEAEGAHIDRSAVAAAPTPPAKAALALAALPGARSSATRDLLRTGLELTRDKAGREATLFGAYAHLVRAGELGDRPAYGLWGLFHVVQAGVNGARPFAMRVKQSDLPAARTLTTLVVLSLDSAVMIPAPMAGGVRKIRMTDFNIDGPLVKVAGSATLRAASRPAAFSLFDLTAAGSPFRTSPDFVAVRTTVGQDFKPDDPALPASAYVQYVGVFRGSDWAPPLP